MLTIIFVWVILFILIYLIGRLLIRYAEWYEYFWIGLAAIFALLQIWSLFLPVNSNALFALFTLGVVSVSVFRRPKFPKINIIKSWTVKNRFFLIFTGLALVVISYYASQSVGWDDSLLYHFNAVKWGKLYPVVPGLANLHTRLGFNSSFFLFASMLDSFIMRDRSSHIALSILAAVLSVEYIWILFKSQSRSLKIFCLFTAPFIFHSIAKNEIIASFSTDFALALLVLAVAVEFIKKERQSILTAGILSILIITVKFSAIVFSALIIIFFFFKNKNVRVWILLWGLLLIVPFLIRNVYLSGWLLYPLPFFKMNVDWAMPAWQVENQYKVIQTWAKHPGGEYTQYINSQFWQWFPAWYQSNQRGAEVKMFAFALLLLFLSLFIKIFDKKYIYNNINMFLLTFISLAGILYIFFTAPDVRFGAAFIWVFFTAITSTYIGIVKWNHNIKILTIVIASAFLLSVAWPISFDTAPMLRSIRWDQAWPTENINGILMPTKLGFCGNSDLPCSPETNNIKERAPGDISKGYAPVR